MPNTTRGYPYPNTSAAANVPSDLQALAGAIDTDVAGMLPKSTVTTQGDLIVATASATVTRLGAGTNGQVLVRDTATATGLAWKDEGEQQEIALVMGIYN